MGTAAYEEEQSVAAADENSIATHHPTWRRIVAGGMAFAFALAVSVFGLLLCVT